MKIKRKEFENLVEQNRDLRLLLTDYIEENKRLNTELGAIKRANGGRTLNEYIKLHTGKL